MPSAVRLSFIFHKGFFFFFGKITESLLTFKDSVVEFDMIIIFKNLELEQIQIFFLADTDFKLLNLFYIFKKKNLIAIFFALPQKV